MKHRKQAHTPRDRMIGARKRWFGATRRTCLPHQSRAARPGRSRCRASTTLLRATPLQRRQRRRRPLRAIADSATRRHRPPSLPCVSASPNDTALRHSAIAPIAHRTAAAAVWRRIGSGAVKASISVPLLSTTAARHWRMRMRHCAIEHRPTAGACKRQRATTVRRGDRRRRCEFILELSH
jgi:hypothetical protein